MSEPTSAEPAFVEATEPAYGNFLSGVALTFGTRLLMLAGVFGSGVIVARWLGPEGVGIYGVLSVTVALALQIGSAGLPSANTYFIASDRKTLGPIWTNAILFALVVGTSLAGALVAIAWLKPSLFQGISLSLLTIAVASIPFQLLTLLGLNVLLAMDRIRQLNLFDSLFPALVLLNAVVVLMVLREQLFMLIAFNTAASIVLSLVLLWLMRRMLAGKNEYEARRPDSRLLKSMLAYGFKFYISIMASTLIFRVDLLFVNHFRGAGEAGVYAVTAQVSFLLLLLPGVIATLLFPRVASAQDRNGHLAIQVTRHVTAAMLILCLAAAAGSFLLPWIYGARFADAIIQLLILLPGIFLVGLESVLVQHFTGTGLPALIPVFWLITLVTNLGLNLLLVPRFGARGAATASSLSYALIFLLVTIYFCRQTGARPSQIFLWRRGDLRGLVQGASTRLQRSIGW